MRPRKLQRLRRVASQLRPDESAALPLPAALPAARTAGDSGPEPEPVGPLSAQQMADFKRDGFVNGGPMLAPAELAELLNSLDGVLKAGPAAYDAAPELQRPVLFHPFFGTGHQIVNLFQASGSFRKLLYHPAIVRAVQQLMGCRELYVWHDQLVSL